MKIVISFMDQKGMVKNPDHLFGILDTKTENLNWIKLSHMSNTQNFVHGMGMCYDRDFFHAGIIPLRERLTSNLLTINLLSGEKHISYLYFTKAIHGITRLDRNRLLVAATQNDCLVELCTNESGYVVTEDLYHHIIEKEYWEEIRRRHCDILQQDCFYRAPSYVDDNYHMNDVLKYKNHIYVTMFRGKPLQMGMDDSGVMFNLRNGNVVINNLSQPHTPFIDSKRNACICNSSKFKFIVKDKFEVELDGYTRGICEEEGKGYWVGISAYRKYNAKLSRWVEKYKGDQPLQGARIQFVDYKGKIGKTIELKDYGPEIFDLLPMRDGKWFKGGQNEKTHEK